MQHVALVEFDAGDLFASGQSGGVGACSAARASRISENRSVPALQIVSTPSPATMPRASVDPVAGKVPNCISMSVVAVMVTVPPLDAMRSNSSSVSWLAWM
jgi:hypothetical protein